MKFKLINPYIIGQFNTEYDTKNALDAVKQFWSDLSPHLTNNVPNLVVTLQSGGDLYHYSIKEKFNSNKTSTYSIQNVNVKLTDKQKDNLLEQISSLKGKEENIQSGGRKKRYESTKVKLLDDSSSSSSSDSDSDYYDYKRYKRLSQPIGYWWYNPFVYKSITTKIYTPTFNVPLTPYVAIATLTLD
uniref:Uncharacterized protein n=1 Tax=viral metagenome TaxID=1070528 RepID=A0A6C0ECE0_9ZZZZ